MLRVALFVDLADTGLAAAVEDLAARLRSTGMSVLAGPGAADVVVVFSDREPPAGIAEALRAQAPVVLLAGPTLAAWRDLTALVDAAGLVPGRETPVHETRLLAGRDGAQVARRAGEVVVTDKWLLVDKAVDDVEVLFVAHAGLARHPVMTWQPASGVGVLTVGSTAQTLRDPAYQRLVHRWVRHAAAMVDAPAVRVGMLGFGAIGVEHARAITAVDGLELVAVCDRNPERVDAARLLAPGVNVYDDGELLLGDDEVDLVIVSTPPNSHADWSLRALASGRHVVVEKPFALTVAEADDVLESARSRGLHVAAYQNRRFDRDFLAVRDTVESGAIGEVFHYESFVGGYGHPCNYWHSDEEVSGGAIYDWGSHYLDWALQLLPQRVEHVTAASHKRMWHDVTNADHVRVTVRFADGAEAQFVHSDLAAALKPKWYVLGTRGAVVGDWRRERVVSRDPVGNLAEDELTVAESPAVLSRHDPAGSVTTLALPAAAVHPFHRELADVLVSGWPMTVTAEQSRRVVAVLEAATASARDGGRPVAPAQ